MTHPTDDELEAMALHLLTPPAMRLDGPYLATFWRGRLEAAAMLRACKGRDAEKQAYIKGTQSGWDAAIEAAAKVIDARKSVLEVGSELSDRVRNLKEGPRHD